MQFQNLLSEMNQNTDAKKAFGGILENWFIHIDRNNRFCVLGTNLLVDNGRADLTTPVLYIDTHYWIAETATQFYLLGKKNTSTENKKLHYQQLPQLSDITPQLTLL